MDTADTTKASLSYAEQLKDSPLALEWLYARGLKPRTIKEAHLGYVGRPAPGHGRFKGSISIPYPNPTADFRSIRFRYLDQGRGHKYDSLKGVKAHLYNVANSAKSKVWITEGEFDSLILSQLGFPSVGVAGANGFKPSWKYLFSSADEVTLVFDSDDAGRAGSLRLASILGEVVGTVRLARLPYGKDVTDVYLQDPRELRKLVE